MTRGTTVFYNGVTLNNVITREFDSESIYDPSGTDLIGRKVTWSWSAIVHSQNVATAETGVDLGGVLPTARPGDKAVWLQELLSQPRKTLTVVNGAQQTAFFHCEPATPNNINRTTTDSHNGPFPKTVKVTGIAGDKLFRVTFSIECQFANCSSLSASDVYMKKANPVVSNRWSVSESMDENHAITRHVRGHIHFTHSLASAHAYKAQVVPPLEDGFRRVAIDFEESENGLEATYAVTDKQVHTAPPWPCTRFTLRHEESTSDSLEFMSNASVQVWGDMAASKADLLTRAYQLVDAKLKITDPNNQNYLFAHLAVVDDVGDENTLSVSVSLKRFAKDQRAVFDLMAKQIGKPLKLPPLAGADPYDPRKSRRPAIWGYNPQTGPRNPSQSFLLHCYVQSHCSDQHSPWQGYPPEKPPKQKEAPYEPSISGSVVDTVTPPPKYDAFSEEHAAHIYTLARMTSRYETTALRAHLPLAHRVGTDTSATVTLGAGSVRRLIDVDCERVGAEPHIPWPVESYAGEAGLLCQLLRFWVETHAPTLAPTGDKTIYRTTAHYEYGLNRALTADDSVSRGALPFTKWTPATASLTLSDTYDRKVGP